MIRRITLLSITILTITVFVSSCAHLAQLTGSGDSEDKLSISEGNDPHEICNLYNDWERQITAYDGKDRVYYTFTCKDKVVFLSPYNTLIYSRDGHVIGFQRDGVFHFHPPSKGWEKGVDLSGVGPIKNRYEGEKDFPDFSSYGTPPTLVPAE